MPPTTTMTKAAPIIWISISRLAGSRGSCKAPPSAAKAAPKANTAVNNQAWFTPNALTIERSCVAARTSVPHFVRVNNNHNKPRNTGPTAIRNKSYSGNCRPKISTAPSRPGARGPSSSSGPQNHKTASRTIKATANVASNWNNSGA